MVKLIFLFQLFVLPPGKDSCFNDRLEQCIKNDELIIVIPAKLDSKYCQLITKTKYLKQYLIRRDSLNQNDSTVKAYLLSCYEGKNTLDIDWNTFRVFWEERNSFIAALDIHGKINTGTYTPYYSQTEKKLFLKKVSVPINQKPYPTSKGALWELKRGYNLSKEDILKLFKYNVLYLVGDGRSYLIDACN